MLTPFMSCTAKLPIYAFFVEAFFPEHGGLIMTGLYILGIVVGILIAFLYKHTLFKGEAVPFVMELPNYRLPGAKNVALLLWDKAKDFLQRAFTIIFVSTIVIWFLQTFDLRFNVVADSADSILAHIGRLIAPVFAPLGFSDWRAATSLITGITAKEAVVSTLEVLLGANPLSTLFPSTLSAASFLVFTLLYTPCFAAIAAVRRETGSVKTTVGLVALQCAVAWLCGTLVYQIGSLFL